MADLSRAVAGSVVVSVELSIKVIGGFIPKALRAITDTYCGTV